MKRAALYARYSTDMQSSTSCEDQLRMLREEATRRGWQVVREFSDAAISGASMFNRPGILQMMAEAEAGGFDIVLAEALDRISRDDVDSPAIRKRLAYHSVTLWTLSEGEVTILHTALKGAMNAMFLTENRQKVRRGQIGVIEDGRSAGMPAYGYQMTPGVRGVLVIDAAEAAIVRRIFAEYDAGKSPRAIAAGLNADGIAGPTGRPWRRNTVYTDIRYGRGILLNPLYTGQLVWGRESSRKHPVTGRRIWKGNPPAEWRRKAVPHLRIIEQTLFDRVQERAVRLAGQRGGAKRPRHLLSGLLRCAECGGPMHVVVTNGFGCRNRRVSGTCSNGRILMVDGALKRITDALRAQLLSPAAMAGVAQRFHAKMAQLQKTDGGRRQDLTRDISEATRRIGRLVDALADGLDSAETREKLRTLEAQRRDWRDQLDAIEARNVIALHPNAGSLYGDEVARLTQSLMSTDPDDVGLREAFRRLVSHVVCTPRKTLPARPNYQLEIHGDLARLLDLPPALGLATAVSLTSQTQVIPYAISA